MTQQLFRWAILVGLAASLPRASRAQFGDGLSGSPAGGWILKLDPAPSPLAVGAKDLAIPIPQGFGHGAEALFPTSPSPFVALGKNSWENDVCEVWDLRTKTKVGAIRGKVDWGKTATLSADGTLMAGKPAFRDTVEVRSTKSGRVVQTIEPIPPWTEYVDFGREGQILAGKPADRSLKVWDIKTGDLAFEIRFTGPVEKKTIAFSPGRRYLAAFWKDGPKLAVYDLADGGKEVVTQAVPRIEGEAFGPNCVGIAFSNDGAELAAIFENFGKVRVVAWDVKDGKPLLDHRATADAMEKIAIPVFYEDRGIQWLPDRSGWLAFGSSIIDRESGKKVWTLPYDNQNFTVSPRRLIDNERALIVFGGNKVLRTVPVPYDKVRSAMRIARAGGNATDASLPKLKVADWSGVKALSFATSPSAWSVVPDGTPAQTRLASRPIPLKTKAGEVVSVLMSGPDVAQAILAAMPSAFGRPDTAEGVPRWADRYDLSAGRHLGRIDLPSVSELIAFSPEASRIAVREMKTKDRLDIYGIDNKPVVGWRPYEQESGDDRAVTYAAFLDARRLVTLNAAGRLVLWSLPEAKAIYAVNNAFEGEPTLSPGRTTLAGFATDTIRFVDTATGALKGEAPGPAVAIGERVELKASAFQSDGGEWAGLFGGGQLVRVNLRSGKVVAEFRSPVSATRLEYCGFAHLLADGRTLVDLATRRGLWLYNSGPFASTSPDARHWFVASRTPVDPAVLAAVSLPEKGIERMSAMLADPMTPAVVRPGSRVGLVLDFGGPPRKADEFRKAVYDLAAKKLGAAGMTVEPGQPTTFTVRVSEKNTGETMELRKIGFGAEPGGPFNRNNIISIPIIDLVCSLDVSDANGVVPCDSRTLGLRTVFHMRIPAGENDVAAYLKDRQWDGLKDWLNTAGMPYFVARTDGPPVRLPGFTDLNLLDAGAR